ncbi:alpha/beta hydrolase [Leptolyngbya sp. 7M]|uniref:alpha/beta hydrolase n=1 Tax=Leptolyngbya sp. 7M TaxID=2812896 RepID=UPI001B8C7C9E|nr:alpha/beta hydrolase family protein [Leptolyngbya sp. 7M]QYO65837.1 esterase family protein [Leptolyngbya sp. 7M]
MKLARIIVLLSFLVFPVAFFAYGDHSMIGPATSATTETRTEKLTSKLMARDLSYRVVLPVGYSEKMNETKRYPVIYLLHGLTGSHANWTERTKLSEYAAKYSMIIITPEGENGWYTDGVTNDNDKYESYIIKELIPEVDTKFRTLSDRKGRAIAGLSMGGYGAIKFGLKYPEMFVIAGSFSGALGAASFTGAAPNAAGLASIARIFGPPGSETRKANDIFQMIRDMTPEKIKALPFLYVDCGTDDFLFQNNREFVELLISKRIPHEYRQLPGGHTWIYWDKQVQEFLRVSSRIFSS